MLKVILLVVLLAQSGFASTKYFAVSGSFGDGLTAETPIDCSTQPKFDAAITPLASGDIRYLAAGTFLTSGNILIDATSVQLIGSGMGSTIVKIADGTSYSGDLAVFLSNYNTDCSNAVIRNMTVDANAQNLVCTLLESGYNVHKVMGILLYGANNALIENVEVKNFYGYASATYGNESWGILLTNMDTGGGIYNTISNASIKNCWVHQLRGNYGNAILITPAGGAPYAGSDCLDAEISGCTVDTIVKEFNNGHGNASGLGVTSGIATNNVIANVEIGSYSESGEHDFIFSNNRMTDVSIYGLQFVCQGTRTRDRVTIIGNTVTCSVNGFGLSISVEAGTTSNVTITGNTFTANRACVIWGDARGTIRNVQYLNNTETIANPNIGLNLVITKPILSPP